LPRLILSLRTRRVIKHLFRWRTGWKTPRELKRPVEDEVIKRVDAGDFDGHYIPPYSNFTGDSTALIASAIVSNAMGDVVEVYAAVDETQTIDARPHVEQVANLLDKYGRFMLWNSGGKRFQPSYDAIAIADELNNTGGLAFQVSPGLVKASQKIIQERK